MNSPESTDPASLRNGVTVLQSNVHGVVEIQH